MFVSPFYLKKHLKKQYFAGFSHKEYENLHWYKMKFWIKQHLVTI